VNQPLFMSTTVPAAVSSHTARVDVLNTAWFRASVHSRNQGSKSTAVAGDVCVRSNFSSHEAQPDGTVHGQRYSASARTRNVACGGTSF